MASAADEVDDLDTVALRERGLRPFRAPDHFAVLFDGETFRPERELFVETFDGRTVSRAVRFPVHDNSHGRILYA